MELTARMHRWRRRLLILMGGVLVLYTALWIVRWARDMETIAQRPVWSHYAGVLNMAHRGASADEPENTFVAFDAALEQGADALELDVRMSADGQVVLFHDESMKRLYGDERKVAEIEYDELVRVALAAGKPAPPTLLAALERYPSTLFNIELKGEDVALAARVAELLRERGWQERVIVVAVHQDMIERFRQDSAGHVATGASATEAAEFVALYKLDVAARPDFDVLQVPVKVGKGWLSLGLGRASFVDFAHEHGLKVHYWTVDDPKEMEVLLELGADGIMTNHPDRLSQMLAARRH